MDQDLIDRWNRLDITVAEFAVAACRCAEQSARKARRGAWVAATVSVVAMLVALLAVLR